MVLAVTGSGMHFLETLQNCVNQDASSVIIILHTLSLNRQSTCNVQLYFEFDSLQIRMGLTLGGGGRGVGIVKPLLETPKHLTATRFPVISGSCEYPRHFHLNILPNHDHTRNLKPRRTLPSIN